ncbi:MAG: hypothetical protein ACXVH5_08960, partial [Ilumatobacteraceae bacterium]
PGSHVPGPLDASQIVIERRDGSIETIECAGANAYAGMVAHFEAVVAGEQKPIFGRPESMRLATMLDELHEPTPAKP